MKKQSSMFRLSSVVAKGRDYGSQGLELPELEGWREVQGWVYLITGGVCTAVYVYVVYVRSEQ